MIRAASRHVGLAGLPVVIGLVAVSLPRRALSQLSPTTDRSGRIESEGVLPDEGATVVVGSIGDPWWDAAWASLPAASGPTPADAAARGRQHAEARLADVRRSRGIQILKRELSLVKAACPDLGAGGRAEVLAAGRQAVAGQVAGRTPLVEGVEKAVEAALRQHAGPAAARAYRAELDARVRRRRAAAIAIFVDAIDREMLLDASGRAALREALAVNWRPEWESAATLPPRQHGGGMRLPDGVAEVAAAVLDEDMVGAWRRQRAEEAGR